MEQLRVKTEDRSQDEYDVVFNEIIEPLKEDLVFKPIEELTNAEAQEMVDIATPEINSDPQLEWAGPQEGGKEVDEHTFNLMLNYRLTESGITLDAARKYLDTEQDVQEWMQLKRAVAQTKSRNDWLAKSDAVRVVEKLAYEFAMRHHATVEDYIEAKNGN
jgi:hypothetical protein